MVGERPAKGHTTVADLLPLTRALSPHHGFSAKELAQTLAFAHASALGPGSSKSSDLSPRIWP